ncbi:MAG TPA: 30S ribosomal protein S17 [Verrucomicrobiota bacterium]|nr:30S ribosomal protein S17 [Verrucomicrobiota bacterium]
MEETKTISKSLKKERIGVVVSDKMQKTIVVEVHRRVRHPKFKKIVSKHKKFYVHDEKQEAKVGDIVRIEETRPLSKLKRWQLVEIVERAD